jgi:hypothetical protein
MYTEAGVSKMDFRIGATIAGSETDGSIVGLENIKHTDFYVKFIEQSQASQCANNFLT